MLTFNVAGLADVKLDGEAVANIYLSKITKWNDAKLMALNPGRQFAGSADRGGAPVGWLRNNVYFHELFVQGQPRLGEQCGQRNLGSVADGFGRQGKSWRRGGGKNTAGSIGYVELAYAVQNKLPFATQINKDGKEVRRVDRRRGIGNRTFCYHVSGGFESLV